MCVCVCPVQAGCLIQQDYCGQTCLRNSVYFIRAWGFSKARFRTEGSAESCDEMAYLILFCPELAKFM